MKFLLMSLVVLTGCSQKPIVSEQKIASLAASEEVKNDIISSEVLDRKPAKEKSHLKGMTWGVFADANPVGGYSHVSCHGQPAVDPASPSCNAYQGDTSCDNELPVLCINKSVSLSKPANLVTNTYFEWSHGEIDITSPVAGLDLKSLADADEICRKAFGSEWRMAEFHDGWGWGFLAKGEVQNTQRFWVHINDQPANCWDNRGHAPQPEPESVPEEEATPLPLA